MQQKTAGAPAKPECIGVAVVHGIGEQRRFEHLDGQVRDIVNALKARDGTKVTVEITGPNAGPFHADQETWAGGPTVRLTVSDTPTGKSLHIHFHEVWWADINEPYSFVKQIRFWWWGLGVWLFPDKEASTLASAPSVRPPVIPGRSDWQIRLNKCWTRARLFGVAFVAVVSAASVGLLSFLAKRLLNLRAPDFIRVFVNYVAGVKLFNQPHRYGVGFPAKNQDYLDTLGEPPRVSVRRRMIRTLLDMAEGPGHGTHGYDRWYVLAHSLGAVVAFNGLMETAYAWPGYLDEKKWSDMRAKRLAGFARPDWPLPAPNKETSPARPVGIDRRDIAFRSHILANFHGLLTFGSPLEKFAAIWPARVPISKEPAFRRKCVWINVYDPVDPVSGVMRAFGGGVSGRGALDCCPEPKNFGFAAGNILLLNHLKYLNGPYNRDTLADRVAQWLITGDADQFSANPTGRWFAPDGSRHHFRSAIAWTWWILAVALLLVAGALALPVVWSLLVPFGHKIADGLRQLLPHVL